METRQLYNIIPAERVAAVANAVEQTFGAVASEIVLLKGGLSGAAVYKIVVVGQSYVLKLDAPFSSNYLNAKVASAAGVAPKLFYAEPHEGISIYEFIDAKPIRSAFNDPVELAIAVGRMIRELHEMPVFENTNDMAAMADGFIGQFRAMEALTGAAIDEALLYYEQIKNIYPWHDSEKVSSHNDLNPNNILFDGERIRVIDWDASFANDRYVDLAIGAISFANSSAAENALLTAYFGDDLNDVHRARFFLMRQVCRMIYASLMFQKSAGVIKDVVAENPGSMQYTMADIGRLAQAGAFDITDGKGQFYYGMALFNEALRAMRSEGFEWALALLAEHGFSR